jgi:hypothetical protein
MRGEKGWDGGPCAQALSLELRFFGWPRVLFKREESRHLPTPGRGGAPWGTVGMKADVGAGLLSRDTSRLLQNHVRERS